MSFTNTDTATDWQANRQGAARQPRLAQSPSFARHGCTHKPARPAKQALAPPRYRRRSGRSARAGSRLGNLGKGSIDCTESHSSPPPPANAAAKRRIALGTIAPPRRASRHTRACAHARTQVRKNAFKRTHTQVAATRAGPQSAPAARAEKPACACTRTATSGPFEPFPPPHTHPHRLSAVRTLTE